MDGLLLVDKPSGPTSHDIVARARRALRERRIGHTGTLDPMASGALPLVIGRATRLARFLSGTKAYDAVIRLGVNTDTCDALGRPVGSPAVGPWPSRAVVDAALEPFRSTFVQQPPAFSAKKIGGRRSYAIARQARSRVAVAAEPDAFESGEEPQMLAKPVAVTAYAIDLIEVTGDRVRLAVRCSAGFYVRSLAFDLGAALGTGAHLVQLRRTEAAGFGLERAVSLEQLEHESGVAAATALLVPMEAMLPELPAVSLTDEGVSRVRFGSNLGPAEARAGFVQAVAAATATPPSAVRLLAPSGNLVALADAATSPGLLHPAVVLL
ncbi:MAG TPA: tRNA pseudouridine(55) synthase TruB [Vicinamibacterales bacterium]|nr:tRNA pseudouridine(55) synthase TruB [Vicinamibacterales bacterium]